MSQPKTKNKSKQNPIVPPGTPTEPANRNPQKEAENPQGVPSNTAGSEEETMVVKKAQLAKLLEQNARLKDKRLEMLFDLKQTITVLLQIADTMKGKGITSILMKITTGQAVLVEEMQVINGFVEKYAFVMDMAELPALDDAPEKEEGKEVALNP